MGAGGRFIADILMSRLLPLAIAIAAIYLYFEGRREKEPALSPPIPPIDNSAKQTQNASPQITQQIFLGDQKAKDTKEEKEKFPSVSFLRARPVLLHQDAYGVWHEADQDFSTARRFDVTREQVTAVLDFAARSLEASILR
jgi:hypothetical protein